MLIAFRNEFIQYFKKIYETFKIDIVKKICMLRNTLVIYLEYMITK